MPGEDVDDAALAVDRERHLRREDPVRHCLAEPARDRLVQHRVRPIEQPVEVATTPARDEIDPDLERCADGPQAVDGLRADLPALDPRDRRLGDARSGLEVRLAPATAWRAERNTVPILMSSTVPSLASRAYPTVIRPLRSTRYPCHGSVGTVRGPSPSGSAVEPSVTTPSMAEESERPSVDYHPRHGQLTNSTPVRYHRQWIPRAQPHPTRGQPPLPPWTIPPRAWTTGP